MKHELKPQDAPKIALVFALLLALGGAGWVKSQQSAVNSEHERAEMQAKRESGARIAEGDENLSPEAADEAENNRENTDPNFRP